MDQGEKVVHRHCWFLVVMKTDSRKAVDVDRGMGPFCNRERVGKGKV